MKKLFLLVIAFCLLTTSAFTDTFVNGYYRKNGTYVRPHYRSSPNYTVRDNWSYKGNINPYTGKVGTNYYRNNPTSEYYDPYYSYPTLNYPSPNYDYNNNYYSGYSDYGGSNESVTKTILGILSTALLIKGIAACLEPSRQSYQGKVAKAIVIQEKIQKAIIIKEEIPKAIVVKESGKEIK